MKKEFTAAAKKMKVAAKTPVAPVKGKKRTYEKATTNTKITLTVGGVSITVDQQIAASITSAVAATAPAAKKAKVTKDSAATPKKKPDKDDAPTAKPKKSAKDAESNKSKPSATTEKPAKKATTTKTQVKPIETKPQEKVAPAKTKAIPKPKDPPTSAKPKVEPKSKKPSEEETSEAPVRKKQTARRSKPFNPYPNDRPSGEHPQHTYGNTPDHWNDPPHIKPESDKTTNGTYLLHLRSRSPDNVPQFDGPPRLSIHHDIYTQSSGDASSSGSRLE